MYWLPTCTIRMYYIVIDEHVEIKLFQLNFELIKWISMLIRCLWFSTVGKSSWISYIQAIINHWRILWNAPETCTNMINTDDFIIPQYPNRYGTVFTTKEKNQSNHFISYLFINLFVDYSLARFMLDSYMDRNWCVNLCHVDCLKWIYKH